jgi:hemerythrin-like domain-containing protein
LLLETERSIVMRPTEILVAEHRVIEQVLSCLDRIAGECRKAGRLDADSARKALDFFRNFADRCHHGKEETHLFPAMEARGFPRQSGPTGVMLQEHEQGRAAIRGMAESVDGAARGDADAVERFVRSARGYVELLRQHIEKEDHCLFPMADDALTAADQKRLAEAFDAVETEHMGAGTHERYLALADELAAAYGVSRAARTHAGPGCGCGHGGGHGGGHADRTGTRSGGR